MITVAQSTLLRITGAAQNEALYSRLIYKIYKMRRERRLILSEDHQRCCGRNFHSFSVRSLMFLLQRFQCCQCPNSQHKLRLAQLFGRQMLTANCHNLNYTTQRHIIRPLMLIRCNSLCYTMPDFDTVPIILLLL